MNDKEIEELIEYFLSRKKFKISGMCQECQNKTFVEPIEELNDVRESK